MKTATVFNHAGGAGKTSVVRDVGYEFARRGARALLVDLDPQANLTSWLGLREVPLEDTIFSVITERRPLPKPREAHGLHVVPSHVQLAMAEALVLGQPGAHYRLAKALEAVRGQYDLVLVDSPPSIGQLAIIGAGAADHLIVPIPTRAKGLDALPGLNNSLDLYRQLQPDLSVALYIPTMFDSRRNHDNYVLDLFRQHLSPISDPLPERAAVWVESNMAGEPVGAFKPGSAAYQDVQRLTDQVAAALNLEWC